MSNATDWHSQLIDNIAVHPGAYVKDEIDARGWSTLDLAAKSGCSKDILAKIISCRARPTIANAIAISKAFGVSSDLLVDLTKDYNSVMSRREKSVSNNFKLLKSTYPLREMIRRGWLRETQEEFMAMQMIRFFEVSDTNELLCFSPSLATKKTDNSETNPVQLAWLYRVRQLARLVKIPKYSENKLRKSLHRLKSLMTKSEDVQFVPDLLRECGVQFAVVETLKGAKICGASCWLTEDEPVIGLTTRYDRIDNLWFVLRHEIEHVLCKHGMEKPILDGDTELSLASDIEEHEKIANKASLDFGIPHLEFESFMETNGSIVKVQEIRGFANRQNIHPGIVAGFVRRRLNRRNILNGLNEKIRSNLLKKAVYDGWGHVAPVQL